ncbi:MAG: CARDB domain-containing protein, partial [Candidatus Thermoplasmatota archaeon]
GAALPPDGEWQREELVVLASTWFEYPEERNELRITDIDIDIPKDPILGKGYEAKATIHNIGFTGVSANAYFYENDIIIDSTFVYIPPRNTASTQVIWRPYYAATEAKFRVIVDRDNDVPEIGYPEKLLENNEAIYKTPILGATDLSLSRDDISISNRNPVKGDNIFINVIVRNLAAEAGTGNLTLYDENVEIYKVANVSVSAGGEASRILWYYNIEPGGVHNLTVAVENVTPFDLDTSNNRVGFQIVVLGKILIVDDDAYPNDGSVNDAVGFMETALYSGGFEYTLYQVPSATANGPQYDLGEVKLKDYDIVIWMCGRTTSSTLTGGPDSGDQQNLTKYLRNGGKLWLIGEGIIDDAGTINAFVNQKLRVDPPGTSLDSAPQDTLYGNSLNPISAGMVLETTTLPGGNKGDYIGIDPDALKMFNDSFGNCSLTFEGNVDANAIKPTKIVFFTFEFSTIKNADDRTWLAYKIILWFGNVTSKIGRDVAVTDIVFVPPRVTFRQTVNITATIRNNGIYDEPRVGVMFYIDDIPIAPAQYVSINGTNSTTVSEIWVAQPVGWHVVRVFADPYYEIDETDERNNELRSRVISNQLYVQYSILIVDDDNSTNNGGDG